MICASCGGRFVSGGPGHRMTAATWLCSDVCRRRWVKRTSKRLRDFERIDGRWYRVRRESA